MFHDFPESLLMSVETFKCFIATSLQAAHFALVGRFSILTSWHVILLSQSACA